MLRISADRTGRPVGPRSEADNWWLVGTAALIIYMAQLDTTIVQVALPTIESDLTARTAVTQWVVLGYLVPLVGLTLLSGRWLDTVGHRAALTAGAAGFAVTSVAAGLAPHIAWLVTARLAQGVFAAVLLALAPVLAVQAVRPATRGRALGVVGALAPLGAMSGPVVGGFLVDSLGWPWVFYVTAPVAVAAVFVGRRQLSDGGRLRLPQLRWLTEVALLGGAAVAVLLALSLAADRHPGWLLVAAAAPPLLGVWRRSAVSTPVRGLLALPGMAGPHVSLVTAYAALLAVQFLAPFYLTRELGISTVVAGTTLLALPAATALAGSGSGVLSDRAGPRPVALAGAAIGIVGLLLLVPLSDTWSAADVAWRLATLGFGFGLFGTPTMAMAMSIAPGERHGLTAATTNLARMLGLSLGPAVATLAWATAGYTLAGLRTGVAGALLAGVVTLVVVALARTPAAGEATTSG